MQRLLTYFLLLSLPLSASANGNDTLANYYRLTDCGVDYLAVSQVLGKRFSPPGLDQPAPFVISGLPPCAKVEKAFLYASASGNGDPQTVVITGPQLAPSFPMSIIGTAPDKCWGYPQTVSYRADITPAITGNGTYTVNGLSTGGTTDIDGASIVVIYSDPTVSWRGTILIDDGAQVGQGSMSYTMHYIVLCNTVSDVKAFMAVGDVDQGEPAIVNGVTVASPIKYWNFYNANTSVLPTQTVSDFRINSATDCYNIVLTGLYYRSTCGGACSLIAPLQIAASATPSRCDSCNGTAHVTATGGDGNYTYSWAPTGGNAADATGLCPGVYTVTVQSNCGPANAIVTVPDLVTSFTLGHDIMVCDDSTVRLKPNDTSAGNYLWSTGSTECCINVNSPGTYWLRETDACGSTADTIQVTMQSCDTKNCIYFPNAFTPNNDGNNDTYGPVIGCKTPPENYYLRIYNRWEQKIFESRDVNYKWDGRFHGTPQDIGVYYYLLKYGAEKRIQGNFTLVK